MGRGGLIAPLGARLGRRRSIAPVGDRVRSCSSIAPLIFAAALVAGCGGGGDALDPLPRSMCSQLVTARGAQPDLLVAADMPRRGRIGPTGRAMADAVRIVLERRGYRAGSFRLGFQSCDDSTAATGAYDVERCASNGKAYGANPRVIGVVGPVHSACASAMLPDITRAGLALVSPAATRPWLTRPSPGTPDLSGRLYPTGDHTFFRVAPPDTEQAAVAVQLARRLGARRLFILREADDYGMPLGAAAANAARAAGMGILGPASWDADGERAAALAREVRASGADAAFLGGVWDLGGAAMAAALRARLGPRFPIVGSDGFVLGLPPDAARAADGMWITVPGLPAERLPARGREVVARVGAGQPSTLGPPYAAQAAELLLAAIAGSDGTRADVVRRLRTARLADGPVGPMRFDRYGDPIPRQIALYRVRGSAVLPVR